MRVFLSYGHDRNSPLVERIRADLEEAGHSIWIDTSEIKTGDDWRRRIVDGLKDSDWTLAFLSKHSIREPGVCLDEMAIALGEKAGAIATVLVEDEQEVQPPVSIGHIQWLDMHDWQVRQATDEAAFELWYHDKLEGILRLLASPCNARFAGEIEELARRLRPISQEADIGPLVDGFVGRHWLLDALEAWRTGEQRSRLFWVTGAPGTGKSAFAAWIAHFGRANVIGLNFCRYNIDSRRNPGRVLCTLAFQIAARIPDYRRLLLDRLRLEGLESAEIDRKTPAVLFDLLLVQPLRLAIDGGRSRDRFLVVIDALDETIDDRDSDLARVLAEQAPKFPEWIALVVTSRPEPPIARQFAELQPNWITAEAGENLADLRVYARGWLSSTGRSADETAALVEGVVLASGGNFLYLRKLREAVEAGLLDLAAPETLPHGLIGLYARWFRRQFPDRPAYELDVVPLLTLVLGCVEPLNLAVAGQVLGWRGRDRVRVVEPMGSLFPVRNGHMAPFHKSLADWLVDPDQAGEYYVPPPEPATRQALVQVMLSELAVAAKRGELEPYDNPALFELTHQARSLGFYSPLQELPVSPGIDVPPGVAQLVRHADYWATSPHLRGPAEDLLRLLLTLVGKSLLDRSPIRFADAVARLTLLYSDKGNRDGAMRVALFGLKKLSDAGHQRGPAVAAVRRAGARVLAAYDDPQAAGEWTVEAEAAERPLPS